MQRLVAHAQRFLENEDGPTAVEYAVLVGLLVVALVTVMNNLGSSMSTTYSAVAANLNAVAS